MSLVRETKRDPSLQVPSSAEDIPASKPSPGPPAEGKPRTERRREPRYPAHDIVEVQVMGDASGRFGGVILDISKSGLRIEIGRQLGRGAQLEIVLPQRAIIFGEARYCRLKNKLYHVGVEIEGVYFAQPVPARHIDRDALSRYSRGTGLAPLVAMEIRNHLAGCHACMAELAKCDAGRSQERSI